MADVEIKYTFINGGADRVLCVNDFSEWKNVD